MFIQLSKSNIIKLAREVILPGLTHGLPITPVFPKDLLLKTTIYAINWGEVWVNPNYLLMQITAKLV
jgi:hypothetical protein